MQSLTAPNSPLLITRIDGYPSYVDMRTTIVTMHSEPAEQVIDTRTYNNPKPYTPNPKPKPTHPPPPAPLFLAFLAALFRPPQQWRKAPLVFFFFFFFWGGGGGGGGLVWCVSGVDSETDLSSSEAPKNSQEALSNPRRPRKQPSSNL